MNQALARLGEFCLHRLWLVVLVSFACVSCVANLFPGPGTAGRQHWDRRNGPAIPHDTFPSDCTLCHLEGSWDRIRDDFVFDHEGETGVPLIGAHGTAKCLRCHNDRGPVGAFAKRGCAGCHQDIHRGQLGQQCDSCHNQSTWIPEGQFALHSRTRFPLTGSHVGVACFRCHPGAQVGNFLRADPRCEICHREDLQRAKAPNHVALGWITDCQRCHLPTTWGAAGFSHSRFPLLGAHQAVDCQVCHSKGVFSGLSHACSSCHLREFNATTSPNHAATGIPTTCEICHNTVAWTGARFNHAGIAANCSQCHLKDYAATKSPNHAATGIPTTCAGCHNTTSWKPVRFSHAGITANCAACHLSNYNATKKPNHAAIGIPTTCERCHGTGTWLGAKFPHTGITTNCAQCHLKDYNATTRPNHAATGYPTNCEACHNVTSWNGAMFNHRFNISSGAHRNYTCTECHRTPSNYALVSCTHCHAHQQADMNSKHGGVAGYTWNSSACASCHPNGRAN